MRPIGSLQHRQPGVCLPAMCTKQRQQQQQYKSWMEARKGKSDSTPEIVFFPTGDTAMRRRERCQSVSQKVHRLENWGLLLILIFSFCLMADIRRGRISTLLERNATGFLKAFAASCYVACAYTIICIETFLYEEGNSFSTSGVPVFQLRPLSLFCSSV